RRPAAGTLELHEGGPIGVQPIKHFRMDRVCRFDATFVIRLPAFRRELLRMGIVKLVEATGDGVPRYKLFSGDERLEQAPPYDFEPFLCRRGAPGRFDPTNNIL